MQTAHVDARALAQAGIEALRSGEAARARELFERTQVDIRDDQRRLQDDVVLGVETCHLEIEPGQVGRILAAGNMRAHEGGGL